MIWSDSTVNAAPEPFRKALDRIVRDYAVPLEVLQAKHPDAWVELVGAFYTESPQEIVQAFADKDLDDIAAAFAESAPPADDASMLGIVVAKAMLAYPAEHIAQAYRARYELKSMRAEEPADE
jgi:hypothetical protein